MLTLGFSPCPNDTFIFYGLANKRVDMGGLDFEIVMEDVQTLNKLALEGKTDVTKVSSHAVYYLRDDYRVLRAGGAVGRGCGPLVVSKRPVGIKDLKDKRVAVPGGLTTAALLFRLFYASHFNSPLEAPVEMPFHRIMEAVRDGSVDAGVIIHEGRFTFTAYGLSRVADLGEWWEGETGLPIPLGAIVAKKALGEHACGRIENIIRASVNYALHNREEAMPYIRSHSQELSGEVIRQHIELYVNDYTLDMGDAGVAALDELLARVNNIRL